jgi:hypothetical protein
VQSSEHRKNHYDRHAKKKQKVLDDVDRGSVGMMHNTILQEVGLHPRILEVGDQQVMHFIEGTDGPFWMTPAQRLETKHDR